MLNAGVLSLPQLAGAEKARTGLSSKFTGEYSDPKHPGCQRSIKVRSQRRALPRYNKNNPSVPRCTGDPQTAARTKRAPTDPMHTNDTLTSRARGHLSAPKP